MAATGSHSAAATYHEAPDLGYASGVVRPN